jgi:hypothetical protein
LAGYADRLYRRCIALALQQVLNGILLLNGKLSGFGMQRFMHQISNYAASKGGKK